MKRLFAGCAAVAFALATGVAPAADPPARVAVEPFFKHADYASFKLSPSGKHVAGLVPANGRAGLVAVDVATRKPGEITTVRQSDVGWFEWINDDRLVFTVIDLQAGGAQRASGLYSVHRDGTDFRMLVRPPASGGRYTQFLSTLPGGTDEFLVVSYSPNPRYPDVYRINAGGGGGVLLSLGKPGDVIRWLADRKGVVRAAVAEGPEGKLRTYWRAGESAPWELIEEYRLQDHHHSPVAFDGDGSLVVVTRPQGSDLSALYRFDPVTKKRGELLAAHPHVDLTGGLIYDHVKQRIVGVRYEAERPGVAWFDEDWARIAASIDRALPDRFNTLSRGEGPNVLVYSYSDTDPGTYYLLDSKARKLERLVASRADIKPEDMPRREFLRYRARDGLEIPAWLTLPKDRERKNLPLVVYVHGGPYVRGATWAWNDDAAYLAKLGYAVLQPEFRGSLGWGFKHHHASFKQWGRAMQDDLDDGMDELVRQGIADPKRACIMGASYGGYAVMMGLARDPDRWRCGVNMVGVTDINLLFDVTWSDNVDSTFMKFRAKDMIGDPVADAAQLKATSPLAQAARIRAPVLMAYGANDRRVPLTHGEQMKDALVARGIPVEWVVYADEGHGFLLEEHRFDLYRRVAAFLARNL